MRNKLWLCLFLTLVVVSFSAPAYADLKFSWGGVERIRHEYWENWKDMNNSAGDNRNFFRFKTSLWGQWDYDKDFSLYAKLTDEFKAYTEFLGTSPANPDKSSTKKGYYFDINEVVFDNLYMDIRNFLDLPVNLRLGRQDFLGAYGEGFLIMDGTPQDGSRTFYFNAAKASWNVNDTNTIDLIYINDPRDDDILPIINEVKMERRSAPNLDKMPQPLNTTDEQAAVLYWKNKAKKDLSLEGYYIYKTEDNWGGAGVQAQKAKINTIGSFAKYSFAPFALRGQLAFQFGNSGSNDVQGMGGYLYLDRDFKDARLSPKASIGYIYLSGDDPHTSKVEGWDPLFSRWPWISELYLLSMSAETKVVGYWTNLSVLRVELSLKPTQKTKLTFWYNYMRANEQINPSIAVANIFSGTGKERGHMPQVRLDYAFNKNIAAYLLAEYFIPGNFYLNKDEALFTRAEVQIKF